ncbi:Predicted translation initiation factor related to eIF-3a [Phaffia rhodozyma]|uniref:Eukaryotic translation initiation factor 2A n=1 Tax=Phaffia rhodozyma TaxID=264483 RepID=A0A0F7SQ93_PHARH|nr:Predicted translation initiation factor related to eIF-3a [Phaffia rhodozyma]
MASIQNQFALRAQKSMSLMNASPSYEAVPEFQAPEGSTRIIQYSPNGQFFAYALPNEVVILNADNGSLVQSLAVSGAVEIAFSPKGTYLSTWERYVKPEDPNAQHANLRIFTTATGEEAMSFTQKAQENWQPSFPPSESHLVRTFNSEILLFPTSTSQPLTPSTPPTSRLKVDGLKQIWVGGGAEGEGVAVFVGEKKGAPATLSLYSIQTLKGSSPVATAKKTFYKADKITVKWNRAGNMVLFLTQTDVDRSNQNYYGETNLYLLALKGGFECRVALDKDGPIHDYNWSPNSREFGVVYGYMPSKTVLFDTQARPIHDLGLSSRNFLSFQPHSRLLLVAGFGNLSGNIDVWDRKSMKKVAEILAPDASHCAWSPDGMFIMTAILSPRLRVDNGLKIWYCTGGLMHDEKHSDLYQAIWRPIPLVQTPSFPLTIPAAPVPSVSVSSRPAAPAAVKPTGAYRPPGARGSPTPTLFLREDQGGLPRTNSNGSVSGPNGGMLGQQHHLGSFNRNQQRRNIPGAPPPSNDGQQQQQQQRGQGGKRGGNKKGSNGQNQGQQRKDDFVPTPVELGPVIEVATVDPEADPLAKRIRNLSKKLKAIEELKDKLNKGEKLEATQLSKIKSEHLIRQELASIEK